jgi:hypothetical protein
VWIQWWRCATSRLSASFRVWVDALVVPGSPVDFLAVCFQRRHFHLAGVHDVADGFRPQLFLVELPWKTFPGQVLSAEVGLIGRWLFFGRRRRSFGFGSWMLWRLLACRWSNRLALRLRRRRLSRLPVRRTRGRLGGSGLGGSWWRRSGLVGSWWRRCGFGGLTH